MLKAFFWNKKWFPWAYLGGLFLLVSLYFQVYMSVLINEWYGSFYDLLQQSPNFFNAGNVGEGIKLFWENIIKFFWIAIPYVLLATITGYFTRRYALWWREAITFDYIPRWRNVEEEIEGASQRIQEDIYRFARIVESLGLQVVRAVMTLVAFLPILWQLSSLVDMPISIGHPMVIDHAYNEGVKITINYFSGSLVWLALLVSFGGLIISWFVGIKLPGLEYNNQKVEAAFRKELVYGEDDKKNYASVSSLIKLFTGVRFNYKRLFLHYGYFDVWVNLYDQFMILVPYIVMGPGLFTGAASLGRMVQVSNAFQKVHTSFALFIHNWTVITELRSIKKRLKEFQSNLDKYKVIEKEPKYIYYEHPYWKRTIRKLNER